jgi:antitoxin ParD1/3/4
MSTTSLTISLPEPLKAFVDGQVASGTFPDADAYIQALLREAQKRQARERVEALLQEGLDSGPATPMTAKDWENIRKRLRGRVKKRPKR